jgi:histidyl-tRNA synthetase
MSITKIKGFADLYPPQSELFTHIEATAREVFARYGYEELRTPIIEKTELFARGIGDETDVVQKEMYTFPDRKNRSLTLRPEATAGVVRAYIENKIHQPEKVSKYYTLGPMFRYERPQKGRMRQFHQVNAEVFGSDAAQCDAELILMLNDFLRALGLRKLQFIVNALGCPECRPEFLKGLSAYLSQLDQSQLCEDCRRRAEKNPLRVLDCKKTQCGEILQGAPSILHHQCEPCLAKFRALTEILDAEGLDYELNPRLVRGLDYYRGATFEVLSSDIGAQSAVAGGGRYDGLIDLLGGPKVPAAGFACGMERLALLLQEQADEKAPTTDFYVAPLIEQALTPALLMAQRLRAAGHNGEVGFTAKSLKAQLRAANRIGARYALILGEDELARDVVQVKYLADGGEQTETKQGEIVAAVTTL